MAASETKMDAVLTLLENLRKALQLSKQEISWLMARSAKVTADHEETIKQQADILAGLADLEDDRGNRTKTLQLLEMALPLARKSNDRIGEIYLLLSLSDLQRRMGDDARASDYLRRALVLGQNSQVIRVRGYALQFAMEHSRRENNIEPAIFYGKGAITAFQKVRKGMDGLPPAAEKRGGQRS